MPVLQRTRVGSRGADPDTRIGIQDRRKPIPPVGEMRSMSDWRASAQHPVLPLTLRGKIAQRRIGVDHAVLPTLVIV